MVKVTRWKRNGVQIDDYLDLYNYAGQIGDSEWQRQLLETMQQGDLDDSYERSENEALRLWRTFDEINVRLLELYALLKRNQEKELYQLIVTEIRGLKLQRLDIIRELYSGVKCE